MATSRQLLQASNNPKSAQMMMMHSPGFMSPQVLASPMHPSSMGGGGSGGATGATNSGGMSSRNGAMSATSGNSSVHGGMSASSSTMGKSPRNVISNPQLKPGTRRNVQLIGKTVRINQGPYKGYVGIVKDATDTTARVELHTKCQTISVDIVRLTIVELVLLLILSFIKIYLECC